MKNAPVLVPPPPICNVPALTLTVPVLLNTLFRLSAVADVLLIMPALLSVPEPPTGRLFDPDSAMTPPDWLFNWLPVFRETEPPRPLISSAAALFHTLLLPSVVLPITVTEGFVVVLSVLVADPLIVALFKVSAGL